VGRALRGARAGDQDLRVIFRETPLAGAWVIDVEPAEDERGLFARTFDAEEWAARGLEPIVVQCSTSYNTRAGTLRGMHYQEEPYGEAKLVRCTRGAVYDVVLDLRRDSPTFRGWFSAELTAENRRMLYVARGLAHGFQTLVDDSEVSYQISQRYSPEHARGVRWDDPAFRIEWPGADERTISERDRSYPDFRA
jgi:dTDP-4-dehydrorhamnose 3,5-epimerase